jgi:hypothetical protein
MRYVIAIAIAFSVVITSATGQQVTEDTSANATFLGCKAFWPAPGLDDTRLS